MIIKFNNYLLFPSYDLVLKRLSFLISNSSDLVLINKPIDISPSSIFINFKFYSHPIYSNFISSLFLTQNQKLKISNYSDSPVFNINSKSYPNILTLIGSLKCLCSNYLS